MPTNGNPRPKFSDPALQQALDEGADAIEKFHSNLDALSDDIKKLEGYLEKSGVRMETSIDAYHSGLWKDDERGIYRNTDSLEWAESETGGRWRVMCHSTRDFGSYGVDMDFFTRESETLDRRPLIETTTEVRLRIYKALPELLKAVAKKVAIERVSVPE